MGFGVYIWNTTQTHEVVSILKRVAPEVTVVLGGPEVSHEGEGQAICQAADYVVQGEGELLFRDLCQALLGEGPRPARKWVSGPLPELNELDSPYPYYTDEDVRNRVIYVEASRGCPYKCEYCLSSLDKSVRSFGLDAFLGELDGLIARGARQFKFVDRTFNLSVTTCTRILSFFLERMHLGLFIHFELVPDRLPPELRELVRRFPDGALQFEIGVQTWSPEVARRISRRQDYARIRENFAFLREQTGVHTHADLIVGLPGETLESFGRGFDALAGLGPDEIQVGILKRLKGTPISRHDVEWGMVYQEHPPFQVLRTGAMDFQALQRMARFSKFWDLVANSGNFARTMGYMKGVSLFGEFLALSDHLSERHPQGHGIALLRLVESVWEFLRARRPEQLAELRRALVADYAEGAVSRDVPAFLRESGG